MIKKIKFPDKNKNIRFDLLFILSLKLFNPNPSRLDLYNNFILFTSIWFKIKLLNLYKSFLFFIINESILFIL